MQREWMKKPVEGVGETLQALECNGVGAARAKVCIWQRQTVATCDVIRLP